MSTPRHRTAPDSSYFVTTKCWQGRCVFQVPETGQIFVETLLHYRDENVYFLHEFVLMPDDLHLLITPGATTSLERAVQLIKGGSSYQIHKQREHREEIWQEGFYDWTIRDANDWNAKVQYIRMNPVRARFVDEPSDWPYSSASDRFAMDPAPRRYLNVPSGAKAPSTPAVAAGLKPRPPKETSSEAKAPIARAQGAKLQLRPPEEIPSGAKAPVAPAQVAGLKPRPPEENAHDSMAAAASSRFPDENARDRAIVERADGSDVHRENRK